MAAITTVLAHQGGWDEILFVLAPLLLFAVLLLMARRRVAETNPDGADDAEDIGATEPEPDSPR